jgi:FkbM family methyltransferase
VKTPRSDSALQQLMLDTKYVRILGRRIYRTYVVKFDEKTRMAVRPLGGDLAIAEEVLISRVYEKEGRPKPGDTVIDAGANIGAFSVEVGELVGPEGRVYSFEPASSSFELLKRNIELNGLSNVTPNRCGLGEEEGELMLNLYDQHGGNTLLPTRNDKRRVVGKERVRIRTVDSFVKESEVGRVDFLKVDTEGFELPVLKGAKETLLRDHPRIAGEAHPRFSDSAETILSYLGGLGYAGRAERDGKAQMFYAWKP